MPLTDRSDLYAAATEDAFNKVIRQVRRQRPSLFNFASLEIIKAYARNPRILCQPLPVGIPSNAPKFTEIPAFSVPASSESVGVIIQLADLQVDFTPGSIALPPEFRPLVSQQLAIKMSMWFGIACPNADAKPEPPWIPPKPSSIGDSVVYLPHPTPTVEQPPQKLNCFRIDVYVVATLFPGTEKGKVHIRLVNLEIVELIPPPFEDGIECFMKLTLRDAIFPKIAITLEDILLKLPNKMGTIVVEFVDSGGSIPNNPSLDNNCIEIFANVTVIP